MIEFSVLGPLQVRRDGTPVLLRAPALRRLLAALLCRPGAVLSVVDLADTVWEGPPSAEAARTLQVYVHRLRKVVGAEANRIARDTGGYRISVAIEELDALRFTELADRARAARQQGRLPQASSLFSEALGLWRGVPYADLTASLLIADEASRLEERRLLAYQDRIAVDLDLGHHVRLISELAVLANAHPYQERLRALLMLALYRSGRQTEALEVFRATRDLLAQELAVEPGPLLQQLHQAILRGDERLAQVAAGSLAGEWEPAPSRPVVLASHDAEAPRELPADTAGFVGRTQELAVLDELVGRVRSGASAPQVATIVGTAGVGKTALAVHWAHRVADQFPDGQLYVNLRGFDPACSPIEPAEAMRGFLNSLGVPRQQIPVDPEAQASRYRSQLSGRQFLILLDNARDAAQVRPLLPGTAGCLAVVTSRSQLTGLVATECAQPLTLGLLTFQEACALLERRLGPGRLAAEPAAVDEVVAGCAGLPLALAIVAARAAVYPHLSLDALAEELRDAHLGLDALSDPDPVADVRAAFAMSYRTLSTDAGRLFRLLGLHPGPEASTSAAASLLGVPIAQVRRPLADLTRAHLINESTSGRYGFHDLLRTYALELTHRYESQEARDAATRRTLDFYLHTAYAAARLTNQHRTAITLNRPDPAVAPDTLAEPDARPWLTRECPVLRAAITTAVTAGLDAHAWQLAWSVSEFLQFRGDWHDWRSTQTTALAAARRLSDPFAQAVSHRLIAGASIFLKGYEDAHHHLLCALELHRARGDRKMQARIHIDISVVLADQGRTLEGITHAEEAAQLCREEGDWVGLASALNGVGWMYGQLGDYDRALSHCQQALAVQQQVGERVRQGSTWDSLGYIYHQLGRHDQAAESYRRALEMARENRDRHLEATVLTHMGDAQLAAGAPTAAGQALRCALSILEELRHPDADQVRAKLRAEPVAARFNPAT